MSFLTAEPRRFERLVAVRHDETIKVYVEVASWTQWATVYDETDRPVATLHRARVYDKGPTWSVHDTNAKVLAEGYSLTSVLSRMARKMGMNHA